MKSKMIVLRQTAEQIVKEDPTVQIFIGNERIVSEEASNEGR